jgi:outer membrane protein assembly factor BamA
VAETTKAFTDFFGNFGFAFAQVEARPEIDRANNRVAFTILADPSRRAYVRRVNISGNNRTRDEVIRRLWTRARRLPALSDLEDGSRVLSDPEDRSRVLSELEGW